MKFHQKVIPRVFEEFEAALKQLGERGNDYYNGSDGRNNFNSAFTELLELQQRLVVESEQQVAHLLKTSDSDDFTNTDTDSDLFALADAYMHGYGVAVDKQRSADLLQRAADMGHPDAMLMLADACMSGDGIKKDLRKATIWCGCSVQPHYAPYPVY